MPCLRYQDAPKAIDWLCRAFGFEKRLVVPGEQGVIAQGSPGQGFSVLGRSVPGTSWLPGSRATPAARPQVRPLNRSTTCSDCSSTRARSGGSSCSERRCFGPRRHGGRSRGHASYRLGSSALDSSQCRVPASSGFAGSASGSTACSLATQRVGLRASCYGRFVAARTTRAAIAASAAALAPGSGT